jgi:hypothetical protein
MPVHHCPVAASERRDLEAEFADRGAHPVNRSIVLAGVAGVKDEPVY